MDPTLIGTVVSTLLGAPGYTLTGLAVYVIGREVVPRGWRYIRNKQLGYDGDYLRCPHCKELFERKDG